MISQMSRSIHPNNTLTNDEVTNDLSHSSSALNNSPRSSWKAVGSPPRTGNRDTTTAAATDHPTSLNWFQQQDYAFPPIRRNSATTAPWTTSRRPSLVEYPDIASVPMLPEVSTEPFFREHRSMSYSVDNTTDFNPRFAQQLVTMQEEEDDELLPAQIDNEMLAAAQLRARSKSSAAAFDIWHPSHAGEDSWSDAAVRLASRRRSSVAVHQYMYSSPPPHPPPPSSFMSNGDRERLASLRRFSLSPMPESRIQPTLSDDRNAFAFLNQRRHSLATPVPQNNNNHNVNDLLDGLSTLRIQQQQQSDVPDDLSIEYPPENMGKGLLLADIDKDASFCVIEFKRGRSDMYFTRPDQPSPARNDLVIVEADRGHDLGKVTLDKISRSQLISMIKQQQEKQQSEDGKKKEVFIKQVIRLAKPTEVSLLMGKSQDEAKALLVCQSKIKQKHMPMQVVDAEYQWDKRKLTFYFMADRRVDFRELVRDLFKLYKTRIWMCAVGAN